jgi:rhodanese-related sulfurtransferase
MKSEAISALYAGEITPVAAFTLLQQEPSSVMVDVRTVPEWTFAGYPDLSMFGKSVIKLSWRLYPTMQINSEFEDQLSREVTDRNVPIIFMCKVGGRSLDAAIAMTASGYTRCYNMTHGFEGDLNEAHQRGTNTGWKAENLPWGQN